MHPLGRKRDLFDAISCFVRGYNYMAPFVFEEYVISDNAVLTIIDIENIDSQKVCERCGFIKEARLIKEKFDRHKNEFVDICLYCKFAS